MRCRSYRAWGIALARQLPALAFGDNYNPQEHIMATTSPTPTQIERAAKLVYEAMTWAKHQPGLPPSWVDGGNSLAQDEARRTAGEIAELQPAASVMTDAEKFSHAESATLAELQSERQSNAGLREYCADLADVLELPTGQDLPGDVMVKVRGMKVERDALRADVAALRAEVARLRAELLTSYGEGEEQARLLGAGGSREAALMARVEAMKKELATTRGAMNAQDEREKIAGEMCGVSWLEAGCDWPDSVADAVVSLRQRIAELEAGREVTLPPPQERWAHPKDLIKTKFWDADQVLAALAAAGVTVRQV